MAYISGLISEVSRSHTIRQKNKHTHTHTHTHTYPAGFLCTNDHLFEDAATYTTQKHIRLTSIHSAEFETVGSKNPAAADLRLRRHGRRDGQVTYI